MLGRLLRKVQHNISYQRRRFHTYPIAVLIFVFVILLIFFILLGYLLLSIFEAFAVQISDVRQSETHKLAVLVPFRDRFDELLQFVPHMSAFLSAQKIPFDIFVVNQVDEYRFNRAALINAGFLLVRKDYDYIAMHDVDLLPVNPVLSYKFPASGPFHVASPELHPLYNYPKFIGGILLISTAHYDQVDGMANKYWGWGMEDDEFFLRLKEAKLNISRPVGITTGKSTFRHIHNRNRRKRDMERYEGQRESMRRRDRESGIRTLAYELVEKYRLGINGSHCSVLNVKLSCDLKKTPWCAAPAPQVNSSNLVPKTNL